MPIACRIWLKRGSSVALPGANSSGATMVTRGCGPFSSTKSLPALSSSASSGRRDAAVPLEVVVLPLCEARRALLEELEFAGEAERDAQVLKLYQIDAQCRLLRDAFEHLEELLTAVGLAVQRVEKRLLGPVAV